MYECKGDMNEYIYWTCEWILPRKIIYPSALPLQSGSMIFLGGTNHTFLSSYLLHHHAIKSFLYSYFTLKVRMILINPDKKKTDPDTNSYKCKK